MTDTRKVSPVMAEINTEMEYTFSGKFPLKIKAIEWERLVLIRKIWALLRSEKKGAGDCDLGKVKDLSVCHQGDILKS